MLVGQSRHHLIQTLTEQVSPQRLQELQQAIAQVHVSSPLLDYCQAVINFTRESSEYPSGLSPRAGLALLTAAKAWAYMDSRDAVIPEDVQAVLASVAGHRLRSGNNDSEAIVAPILSKVAVH